ncbi:MAG TPA: class I SAM-dependent methyltransferase [Polyangiaceae bacterium]|jgi:SAM-dependent methyltransferase|nr:class I SAM-dependent methyltransferase [Polyangiaceae bacterium]
MLAPRYLLREAVVFDLLDGAPPGSFVEIGCGGGELLVALARKGFRGIATDRSGNARRRSRARLGEEGITTVSIVDELPVGDVFDHVFLFEVLGYAPDPVELLATCRELLAPGGRFLVSFARADSGYASGVVHDMRFFTADEVTDLARAAGLVPGRRVNYGYPLANAIVPVRNAIHAARSLLPGHTPTDDSEEKPDTGLDHASPWMRPLSLLSNRTTLAPFVRLQSLFARTNRGNGYVLEFTRRRH